ncbi:synaptotagmin-C-like [Anneissia japonica]|uniref:synaptotagmin-C-like n=1 Tax=Anneissia japonica TaxID=1529436 RepID=UPI0014258606|nr:synaptotagmin-C-like [Anneissia japonica]
MRPDINKMTDISKNSESKVKIWMKKNTYLEKKHPMHILNPSNIAGEVLLCLRYVPPQEKLTVYIIEASNLPCDNTQPIKYYIDVKLFDGDEFFEKGKTSVKKGTSSPFIGETMIFNVPLNKTKNLNIVVAVRKWYRFNRSKKLMGTTLLSNQSDCPYKNTSLSYIFNKPGSKLQDWCTFHKPKEDTDIYSDIE